jgi:hypothetical protein
MTSANLPLRLIVLAATGQDVRQCTHCGLCSAAIGEEAADGLAQLVQWIIANDGRALTALPVYSQQVLQAAQLACANRLDFCKAIAALQAEARRRGLPPAATG